MTHRRYFGTDGIRGRIGEFPITPDFVLKLGWAIGQVMAQDENQKGRVLIGKDTRLSGYVFESALESGLTAAGCDVYKLGPMPTPAIAYLTSTLRANAGIVISASHNPYYDNGIKIFGNNGRKLLDSIELDIEARIDEPLKIRDCSKTGKAMRIKAAPGRYIEFCKSTLPFGMDLKGIKLVLDCANGAAYHIAPDVFIELGAQVISIGVSPNGLNINEGCGSTHIQTLQKAVLENQADLGIALDGDGDRVIMVDKQGNVVDGDQILYIISMAYQEAQALKGGVVGTQMSNLGLEQAFIQAKIPFCRSKVGDRYVMEALFDKNWIIGGESSGHILCLDKTTTGDGIISALNVLKAMVLKGQSLSDLCKNMQKYPQTLLNVKTKNTKDAQILVGHEKIEEALQLATAKLKDKGRILLRPSGTEPLIRVMVEGEDAHENIELASSIAQVIEKLAGNDGLTA